MYERGNLGFILVSSNQYAQTSGLYLDDILLMNVSLNL